ARERQQAVDVGRGDVGVAAFALCRGPGVAGGDDDFVDARRLRELPRQRVLAAAGTDDEDLHAWISFGMPLQERLQPRAFAFVGAAEAAMALPGKHRGFRRSYRSKIKSSRLPPLLQGQGP